MAARGKPFTKNDPRRGKSPGRPKKSVEWKDAEEELRTAIPRLLLMEKNDLKKLLESNPTGAEMLAAKYLHEHAVEAVNRFLGKTPNVLTGAEGKPLIPPAAIPILPPIDFSGPLWEGEAGAKRLDEFIAATAAAVKKAS